MSLPHLTLACPIDLLGNNTQTLDSPSPSLNYDLRRRLTPIESSLSVARDAIASVSSRVSQLRNKAGKTGSWLDRELHVTAKTPAELVFKSTGGREMWFVSHHAVHHLGQSSFLAAAVCLCLGGFSLEREISFVLS